MQRMTLPPISGSTPRTDANLTHFASSTIQTALSEARLQVRNSNSPSNNSPSNTDSSPSTNKRKNTPSPSPLVPSLNLSSALQQIQMQDHSDSDEDKEFETKEHRELETFRLGVSKKPRGDELADLPDLSLGDKFQPDTDPNNPPKKPAAKILSTYREQSNHPFKLSIPLGKVQQTIMEELQTPRSDHQGPGNKK